MPMERYGDESTRSIPRAFAAYHVWFDTRIRAVANALAEGNHESAQQSFAEFARRLRHHMRVEEVFLFDEIDRLGDPAARSVLAAMRAQHQTIDDHTGLVERRLAQRRGVGNELSSLAAMIDVHERLEERVLLPACHRTLGPAARAAAVHALERWLPGRR